MKIAHVSTFPNMKCGIAFYASDLIDALPTFTNRKYALHYGNNLTVDAVNHANVSYRHNVRQLAHAISNSDCDVVSIQHEFGIWGGVNGEYLFDFLAEINKPIVSTLHTTFRSTLRPPVQVSILRNLINRSAVCFVLSPKSKDTLCDALDFTPGTLSVIPHGVPDVPFVPPTFINSCLPTAEQIWRFCSIGFLRPDKGLEQTLSAFSQLKRRGLKFKYVIASSSQPQFIEQEKYALHLQQLIAELELEDNVEMNIHFLTRAEQIQVIRESHAGIFAYQFPDHSSSGTIPLVMAAGRPVICTPFEFAIAKKLEIEEGVMVSKDFSATAIAEELRKWCDSAEKYVQCAYELSMRTRHWNWKTVALEYVTAFSRAYEHSVEHAQNNHAAI